MPINVDKIISMLEILNSVTESMSLYANVEIDDESSKIRFVQHITDKMTTIPYVEFNIHKLSRDKKERITDFNQVLDHVDAYNDAINGLVEAMITLQSLEHHRFQSDYAEDARQNMKDKFRRCINLCQHYKSKTIEKHNLFKKQNKNVITITHTKEKNPHK